MQGVMEHASLETRLETLERNVALIAAQLEQYPVSDMHRRTRILAQMVEGLASSLRVVARQDSGALIEQVAIDQVAIDQVAGPGRGGPGRGGVVALHAARALRVAPGEGG
ncbi:hypothetical protein [Nguyenibacter vanlangensis]|uniref:Uncharacterized protein n=1 Tax=Nguyenibacter vanlangensis TaxID=1216886 RepID=A0A7Y7M4B3_9PROT|nr:hypothetical protein [Nguyenibacter vanlangensis]NVN10615.1 hypothetical protein [Nguyenibacter vanlangensis]